jgi:hypothetical protein
VSKVDSVFSRPVGKSVLAFVTWTTALLLVFGAIDRLVVGRGLGGLLEVVFGFFWVGWIFVLGALPVWLVFRWSLGRFGARLGGSLPLRAALIGTVVWLAAGSLLFGVTLVAGELSPGSQPTLASVVTGFVAVALLGGILGALEGRAIAKHAALAPRTT